MPIVRIRVTMGTSWPCRAFCKASENAFHSMMPRELLAICRVISLRDAHSVEIAANGE